MGKVMKRIFVSLIIIKTLLKKLAYLLLRNLEFIEKWFKNHNSYRASFFLRKII
jgi:hypothetical protein